MILRCQHEASLRSVSQWHYQVGDVIRVPADHRKCKTLRLTGNLSGYWTSMHQAMVLANAAVRPNRVSRLGPLANFVAATEVLVW
jgi:hypothetical protein